MPLISSITFKDILVYVNCIVYSLTSWKPEIMQV